MKSFVEWVRMKDATESFTKNVTKLKHGPGFVVKGDTCGICVSKSQIDHVVPALFYYLYSEQAFIWTA